MNAFGIGLVIVRRGAGFSFGVLVGVEAAISFFGGGGSMGFSSGFGSGFGSSFGGFGGSGAGSIFLGDLGGVAPISTTGTE